MKRLSIKVLKYLDMKLICKMPGMMAAFKLNGIIIVMVWFAFILIWRNLP